MKMKTHFLPQETLTLLQPEEMGLVYTSVQRIELEKELRLESGEEELCLLCLEGTLEFSCGGISGSAQKCDMLYVPIHTAIELKGENAVLMRFGAPCTQVYTFAHIPFSQVDGDERHKVYGKVENGTKRDVWNFIDEKFSSGRFLTGICFGGDGGWTAWPPHEHGAEREEVYIYFDMGDSFGVQCVYDELSTAKAYVIQNGHLIAIPQGYHPNCGSPHGGIRYMYCMVATTEGERDFMDLRIQSIFGDRLV